MAILKNQDQEQQSKQSINNGNETFLPPTLRIVAAGRGSTMSHPRLVATVLSLVTRRDADRPIRVVYLGTATFDEVEPRERQVAGFRNHGGFEVIPLRVSERVAEQPTAETIRDTIESADVIHVSGGNTRYAINRWKQLGIDRLIRNASNAGTVLCGGSAGAICWFQEGHSQSQNPVMQLHVDPNLTEEQKRSWEYMRVDGLGLLPGFCVPHHDVEQSNGVPRQEDSDQMMMREIPHQTAVGIDEGAALVVEGGMARVVSVEDGATCCIKQCEQVSDDNDGLQVAIYPFTEQHGVIAMHKLVSNPSQVIGNRDCGRRCTPRATEKQSEVTQDPLLLV